MTIDKSMLQRKIGKLSDARLNEILNGIYRVLEPAELSKTK
jgi:mRNA-degrading endonuclease toxin of MazEF toxin-antitoxin module